MGYKIEEINEFYLLAVNENNSNLINEIPCMTIYSPTPEVINSCYIQNSIDYRPNNKTILETLSFAYELKVEALKSHSILQIKHPYFNHAEK